MSTITKQLSRDELRTKLDKGDMISRRPDLAFLILSGQCAYEERTFGQSEGENYALKGSPAAYATKDLKPEPMLSRAEPGISDAEVERRLEELRLRHAPRSTGTRSVGSSHPVSDPGGELLREVGRRSAREDDAASDDFVRAARATGKRLDQQATTGDAAADLLRSVDAEVERMERDDFNPFAFGPEAA